jgi:hypothetical protein
LRSNTLQQTERIQQIERIGPGVARSAFCYANKNVSPAGTITGATKKESARISERSSAAISGQLQARG